MKNCITCKYLNFNNKCKKHKIRMSIYTEVLYYHCDDWTISRASAKHQANKNKKQLILKRVEDNAS